MMKYIVPSLLFVVLMSSGIAIPKTDDGNKRVINQELSDEEHYVDEEHNPEYDHEAFVGEEEAREFENLTPEESKARLAKIVDKIDTDKDGSVTQAELEAWIQYTQKRYIQEDTERQWKSNNPSEKEDLEWKDYRETVYGFMDDMDPEELEAPEGEFSYADMMKRDQRRWDTADLNADKKLNKEEFEGFLHPEEKTHMRDLVVLETIEDIDKDKDGKISASEYINDMYRGSEGDEEPLWVANEREQFSLFRDKNGDGFMDKDEVKEWIIPPEFDHTAAEAKHLLQESDVDGDGKLSKEEIVEKYDLFVGSQATDFGEALTRHDEF